MTLYAETSALLRWLFAETGGDAVRAALASASQIVASRLTLIEARRVLRRAEALDRLSAVQAIELREVLARASAGWSILEISAAVAQRAEETFPVEPLRALDAIHLASALFLRPLLPDLAVLTCDERIAANARQLGFETLPVLPNASRIDPQR